jgi:hypothetical protein
MADSSPISAETVASYFKELDWPFQAQDEHNWSTGYKGDNVTFNFQVRTTDSWLYVLAPFPIKIQAAAANNMYKHLLRLNYNMSMAKFSLDTDEDLILSVELPNDNLQLGEFRDALQAACYYMDENYAELVKLATDPTAQSSLAPKS